MHHDDYRDPTSIGGILISMGVLTPEELVEVLLEQEQLRKDHLVGRLLVASGKVSRAQLERAMRMQQAMRDKSKPQAAIAMADYAISQHQSQESIEASKRLQHKSHLVLNRARRISSQDGFPAIGPMLRSLAGAEGD